jgi:hypothetical protein
MRSLVAATWLERTGEYEGSTMADVTDMVAKQTAPLRRRYLPRFEENTLLQRPLRIRLIIEFLGTFVLVTMAAEGRGDGHDQRLGAGIGAAHQPRSDLRLHRGLAGTFGPGRIAQPAPGGQRAAGTEL